MKYSALAETIQGITLVQEADSLPTIYCDMDGVLCDFRKGIDNMFKLKSKDPSMPGPMQMAGYKDTDDWIKAPLTAQKWEPITNYKMFWPTLPWTKDGQKLWFFIRKFNPHILSAYTPYDKNSIKGKQLWIQRNLKLTDASRIHLVRRSEKKIYANGNVLIDDYGRNVKEWKKNKGIPIKYKSASQAIADLRKIGYKQSLVI